MMYDAAVWRSCEGHHLGGMILSHVKSMTIRLKCLWGLKDLTLSGIFCENFK